LCFLFIDFIFDCSDDNNTSGIGLGVPDLHSFQLAEPSATAAPSPAAISRNE
jgi:hypothetical protein